MKKVKLNLDKRAIQDFFIQHVEKVLLVAVALCFLLFVYRAVGRETFARTPQELKGNSQSAEQRVKDTKPVPPKEIVKTDYLDLVTKSSEPIDVEPYRHRHLWLPLTFEPPPKRGEPRLFTVKDLRGAGGYGAIKIEARRGRGMAGAMPGESLRGERWVVLTGLVQYEEQVKAYEEAFKDAADKQRSGRRSRSGVEMGGPGGTGVDRPLYLHYNVQRAEITSPGQSVDDLDWEPIHVLDAKTQAARDWGRRVGTGIRDRGEGLLVSPIYLIAALDFPLPPLVGRWSLGEDFAHAPEIPILQKTRTMFGPGGRIMVGRDGRPIESDEPVGDEPTSEKPGEETPGAEQPDAEKPAADQPGDVTGREDVPVLPGSGRRIRPETMGQEMMNPETMGQEMMAPGMMMPGVPGVGPASLRPGQRMGKPVPNRLFRFVDRTAEPGKDYRYRVRLMLWNPNFEKHPRYLERPELGKEKYITTDWSEPTGVIEVPRDDRLLVASVRPSPRPTAEAEAKLVVLKWLHEKGIEADKVFLTVQSEKAWRGQMLNLPGCKWPEEKAKPRPEKDKKKKSGPGGMPGMEDYGMLMEGPQPEAPRKGARDLHGRGEQEPIDVEYLTESLILDMRGGQRIDLAGQGYAPRSKDPSVNAPGEILVVDPEGKLVVRREVDDAAEYEELQERKKGPGEGSRGPGMYPGMETMPPGMGDEAYLMEQAQPAKGPAKKDKDRKKKTPRERPAKRR